MDPHYILALDVGTRRIGVALASSIARLPAPLATINVTDDAQVTADIRKIVSDNNVTILVVGLPRGMQGQETAQTTYCRHVAEDLGKVLGLPVVLQEETATSIEAEEYLEKQGKPYAKGDIDAYAAVIILRDYLSGQVERTA